MTDVLRLILFLPLYRHKARSVVGGRFVNVYARNDWVLNYLFRASSAATGESLSS